MPWNWHLSGLPLGRQLQPSCGHTANVYTGAWQGSACRLPGKVVGLSPGFGWTTLQRDKGGLLTLEAQNPWGHLSQVSELLPYPLLSTTASSLTLSSAQSPAFSFTSSWSLGPLPSVPGPQISKTLGQGPEHSRRGQGSLLQPVASGDASDFGSHKHSHACVSVRRAGSHHRRRFLPDVLTCPFIAAAVSLSMALQQLLMWP